MDNQNQENQLQIEVKPEVSKGVYSNLAAITHSGTEFVIDFVSMMPAMPKAEVVSRIVMAPEHAKRLLAALSENVQKYERTFGEISFKQARPRQGSTIAPFNLNNQGEA